MCQNFDLTHTSPLTHCLGPLAGIIFAIFLILNSGPDVYVFSINYLFNIFQVYLNMIRNIFSNLKNLNIFAFLSNINDN